MALTGEQVKGRIKNLAKIHKADARVLMRIYMMERFLESCQRLLDSNYIDYSPGHSFPFIKFYGMISRKI